MNPVSFKDVQGQFVLELKNEQDPCLKLDLIESFREKMTTRSPENSSLKNKIAKWKKRTPEDIYHKALEKNCSTLLLIASSKGYTEIAIDLIHHNGMHVNYTNDEFSQAPLHLSCIKGMGETAKIFLKNGALVNVQDVYGNTPLYYACKNNLPKLATYLLKFAGASPFITNNEEKLPPKCITKKALNIMHRDYKPKEPGIFSTKNDSPRYLPRDLRYIIYRSLDFKDVNNNLRKVNRASYNVVTGDILHALKGNK